MEEEREESGGEGGEKGYRKDGEDRGGRKRAGGRVSGRRKINRG